MANNAAAAALVALSVVVIAMAVAVEAQEIPACASKLIPCQKYLNATSAPPDSCCGPLKTELETDLPCLCSLYNDTSVLQAFGVNIKDAINLAKLCGSSTDLNACSNLAGSPSSNPVPPSGNNSGNNSNNNSAHGVTQIGFPSLVSLLICLWSLLA